MDASVYSNFPNSVDTFPVKVDAQYENLADIQRFNELKSKSYLTEVEQQELTTLTERLRDMIWFAEDLNAISGGLTNLQQFFLTQTTEQLNIWKQELETFANNYKLLTQLKFQAWMTTSSKDYDIQNGLESLDSNIELTVDSPANIEVVIDGVQVGYNNYTIQSNSTGKKTIIRFNSSYDVPVGKRMEARWQDTSGRVFSVNSHNHNKSDILDLPNVAKTGNYSDLVGIPSSFSPVAHKHSWSQITEIPSSFTPSAHSHDDKYYTESEIDTKLAGKAASSHKHAIADITGLQVELDNLKSSGSNGKNVVATAITAKGVPCSGSDSFVTLANKIGQINSINVIRSSSETSNMTLGGTLSGHVEGLPPINTIYKFCKMTIQLNTSGTVEVVVNGVDNSTVIYRQTVGAGNHSLVYCFNSQNRPYDGYSSGGFVLRNRHGSNIDVSYSFHYSYVDLGNIL